MDGWAGFTDSDLQKIKGQQSNVEGRKSTSSTRSASGQRKNMQHKRPLVAKSINQTPTAPLDESMLLSKAAEKKVNQSSHEQINPSPKNTATGNIPSHTAGTRSNHHSSDGSTRSLQNSGGGGKPQEGSTNSAPADSIGNSTNGSIKQPCEEKHPAEKENEDIADDLVTDEQEIFKHEKKSLESFQKQHKMIEELNKAKKQKLTQAIQERTKKAKAESAKLIQLQKELSKLDQLLTVDVSIIRNKIEDASRDFLEAQKRYDLAEKEYVEAKMELHRKMEAKESLTEHLYTVIYQNELRKSKKLAELMTKLEMDDAEEMVDISQVEMPHPSLLSPVQLPSGRYGQIGPIHIQTPSLSPSQQSESSVSSSQQVLAESSNQQNSNQPNEGTKSKSDESDGNKSEKDASDKMTSDKITNEDTKDSDISETTAPDSATSKSNHVSNSDNQKVTDSEDKSKT